MFRKWLVSIVLPKMKSIDKYSLFKVSKEIKPIIQNRSDDYYFLMSFDSYQSLHVFLVYSGISLTVPMTIKSTGETQKQEIQLKISIPSIDEFNHPHCRIEFGSLANKIITKSEIIISDIKFYFELWMNNGINIQNCGQTTFYVSQYPCFMVGSRNYALILESTDFNKVQTFWITLMKLKFSDPTRQENVKKIEIRFDIVESHITSIVNFRAQALDCGRYRTVFLYHLKVI